MFYELDTHVLNKVSRSKYGKEVGFEHEVNEFEKENCYIPTKGYCFIKCISCITGLDYMQTHLELIRNEKGRSNGKTPASIQPYIKHLGIVLGSYNATEIWPRDIREKNKVLYLYNNHFCPLRKSERISFDKAIE